MAEHSQKPRRINKEYILSEIKGVLYLDKGLFYTVRELVFRPGKTIRTFIHEDRSRIMKPIFFVIVASVIYSILQQFLGFEDEYVRYSEDTTDTTKAIGNWIQNNYGYTNLIMGVFIAFWVKLLFRKKGYNIYEMLILVFFVMGVGMLLFSITGIIQKITRINMILIAISLLFIYSTWAISQFFGQDRVINWVKAFFAYIMGMVSFSIIIAFIGFIVDLIKQ